MKYIFVQVLLCLLITQTNGQESVLKTAHSGATENKFKLLHTSLSAGFAIPKEVMEATVEITLCASASNEDSLTLDAKQITIRSISIGKAAKVPVTGYRYDGSQITIPLQKKYQSNEAFTVEIRYTVNVASIAKTVGSNTGLHFINPKGAPNKPTQIWTDGEPQYTSFWCPTIDDPSQSSTIQIAMTVPSKFTTLSNGMLVRQKKNNDNTRTDYWKMDQPIAPYVFFMAAGIFEKVHDTYRRIPVDYYVEPKYTNVARKIFGETPRMMQFFSNLTGVPFPWPKYAQIVLRDFTSTAMENTSATAHAEDAQQDARDLLDQNRWENNTAHELFHHWFGDYVRFKSWSHLVLSEGFADYGQYLWKEHRYGADAGGEENYNSMQAYLNSKQENRNLVRFDYANPEEMFDDVSYQKGGRVLHMLRTIVGDSAFFKGLNTYLTQHKYKAAETDDLRLALEQSSGKQLDWFFGQWFFGHGHPVVSIRYKDYPAEKKMQVIIEQKQNGAAFRFPLNVAVYESGNRTIYPFDCVGKTDTLTLSYQVKPNLINVDADKYMLWEKSDEKSLPDLIFQYHHAANYLDRREAIDAALAQINSPASQGLLKEAVQDTYAGLRVYTLQQLTRKWKTLDPAYQTECRTVLEKTAATDSSNLARSLAISLLNTFNDHTLYSLFLHAARDSSAAVASNGLTALASLDSVQALAEARKQIHSAGKRALSLSIMTILCRYGSEADYPFITTHFPAMPANGFKLGMVAPLGDYISRMPNDERFRKLIDLLLTFYQESPTLRPYIQQGMDSLLNKLELSGRKQQLDYVKSVMPVKGAK